MLLRRSRCCDGAAQTSSVALILRVASERRDAQNEEAGIHFSPVLMIQISMVVAHSPRPPPWALAPKYFVGHYPTQLFLTSQKFSNYGARGLGLWATTL